MAVIEKWLYYITMLFQNMLGGCLH